MTVLTAAFLGVIEGITEFLPISSTAHLEIASRLLGLGQSGFVKTFEVVIQAGAVLAVLALYARRVASNRAVWKRVAAAFVPTGIVGFALYKVIKHSVLGNMSVIVWSLALGGAALVAFEYARRGRAPGAGVKEIESMPLWKAATIGLVQSLAVVPGVSRSAATIVAGDALGLGRAAAVEFSFLLAVPTIVAAAGYDLAKSAGSIASADVLPLAVGFAFAFVSALTCLSWLVRFVQRRGLAGFGWYRIVLAAVLAFWLLRV